jgi:plasmid segregation protein ParM
MDVSNFATRTDFKVLSNARSDKEFIIGLDLGYSSTKCFTENAAFCIPSFAREIKGDIVGELGANEIVYTNESGRCYSVGERALKGLKKGESVKETDIYGRNHYMVPEYLIQFRVALGIALWNKNVADQRPIFIETGLPPAYLSEDSAYMRKAMEGRHNFSMRKGNITKKFDIEIDSKQIDIIIQPMGTVASIGTDESGKNQSKMGFYLRSRILIFDGGFGTLDTFYIRDGEVEARNTDNMLGMRRVLDEARQAIIREHHLKAIISIPEMQECLNTGKYSYTDRINLNTIEIDIAPYVAVANAKVREEAFNSCIDIYPDIDCLVMTGGTGAAWINFFIEKL